MGHLPTVKIGNRLEGERTGMKIRSSLYERYLKAKSFYKLSVFKCSDGWKRIEPGGLFAATYPTWESAMRGEQ